MILDYLAAAGATVAEVGRAFALALDRRHRTRTAERILLRAGWPDPAAELAAETALDILHAVEDRRAETGEPLDHDVIVEEMRTWAALADRVDGDTALGLVVAPLPIDGPRPVDPDDLPPA